MTRLDRFNRTVVSLIGALLLATGAYGLLRGLRVFGDAQSEDSLRTPWIADFLEDNDEWLWAAVAILALLVAVGAALWLRAQLRPSPALSELAVAPGGGPGTTRLDTAAVNEAVARDIEGDPDVNSARVRIVPTGNAIGLDVRASVADHGDVHAVRQRIEREVMARARAALGRPDLGATVRLKLGDPGARTVF